MRLGLVCSGPLLCELWWRKHCITFTWQQRVSMLVACSLSILFSFLMRSSWCAWIWPMFNLFIGYIAQAFLKAFVRTFMGDVTNISLYLNHSHNSIPQIEYNWYGCLDLKVTIPWFRFLGCISKIHRIYHILINFEMRSRTWSIVMNAFKEPYQFQFIEMIPERSHSN